jgi:PPM family protein phosphatase
LRIGVVDSAGQTQTGHVRRSNEDSYLLRGPLFMVADGMGGAAAGEIASRIAAEAFAEVDLIRVQSVDALQNAIRVANARIQERAADDPELAGMGTTAIAALVGQDGRVAFGHVGDSRAYLLRDGELRRLTEDHSLVAELVAGGQLSEEEAAGHPQRSVITRALGAEETVRVDTFVLDPEPGDVVLLCSDGLNTMVSDTRIAELLAADEPAERIVNRLIKAALEGGGEDNVTAIVFRMGETDDEPTGSVRTILTTDPDLEPDDEEDESGPSVRKLLLWALVLVLVVALAAAAAVWELRRSYFVGADQTTGHVVVYQGLPWNLFAGVHLYHEVYVSPVLYASLDPQTRQRLFDHSRRSLSSARDAVKQIELAGP